MYLPGTAAVIDDVAAAEAEWVRATAISRPVQVAIVPGPELTGAGRARVLPCAGDPDLFFAESPATLTTPSLTASLSTGDSSLTEASFKSSCRAAAEACRN